MSAEQDLGDLIEQAKRGERTAFAAIVRAYAPRVAGLIRTQLGHQLEKKVEIDDLVQETFLQAWQSMRGLKSQGEETFWSWLAAISHNVIHMQARTFKARKRSPGQEASLQDRIRD